MRDLHWIVRQSYSHSPAPQMSTVKSPRKRPHDGRGAENDEPVAKRPALVASEGKDASVVDSTTEIGQTGAQQDAAASESQESISSESEACSESSECNTEDGEVKRSLSFWRTFYRTPARYHELVKQCGDVEAFIDKVVPPVSESQRNAVMYAFEYTNRGGCVWRHYELVSKDEDAAIKDYIRRHPYYELSLGSLEGKHSDVRMCWDDVLAWETDDPRIMDEYDPSSGIDLLESLMEDIEAEKLSSAENNDEEKSAEESVDESTAAD